MRDPHVKVLYNKRGVSDYALYDEAGIAERYLGVTPAQYTDYAALRGDTSDNLPGVPGIGEKTAAKLITTYNDLDGIFDHLDDLPPKQKANLGEFRDRVFKNREMSRLDLDVDCGIEIDEMRQGAFDADKVRVLFNQLEFRTLAASPARGDRRGRRGARGRRARGRRSSPRATRRPPRPRCSKPASRRASRSNRVGRESVAGARSSGSRSRPTRQSPISTPSCSREDGAHKALGALVGGDFPARVVHRSKELMHGLDVELESVEHDTAVMAYLLDPGEGKYSLEDLALRYLSIELQSPDQVEGTLDLDGDAGVTETGRRAAILLQLADTLGEALRARELEELYRTFELPLVPVLARMEDAGVRIDVAFLNELGKELGDQCRQAEAEIHAQAGEQFNVNSTPQLRRILFEKLGLTPVKRTKTGPSTDADSLQKMAETHPIVETLLRYREAEKLRSTYADALPPLVREDGRIHATFNQLATTTGRISSESPNLQNIPVRTSGGRELRRAFIADDGNALLTADYSQIELRVLAHLRDDPGLIEAFERGSDIHTTTAARVFDVDEAKVDDVPASLREGRELRARVRHGGLRARSASRHPDRSGARDPRRVLRRVPEHRGLHEGDRARGQGARVHDDALRPAASAPRALVRQLPHPPDG